MSTIESLRLLGYRVHIWPCGEFAGTSLSAIEITDLTTAASVYVPELSTLEHCIEMINTKKLAFERAEQTK